MPCVMEAVGCTTIACMRAIALHALAPNLTPTELLKQIASGPLRGNFRTTFRGGGGSEDAPPSHFMSVLNGQVRFM